MSKILSVGALLILSAWAACADVYLRVPVSRLTISGGKVPGELPSEWKYRNRAPAFTPYAVLEGPGEILFSPLRAGEGRRQYALELVIRVPEPRELKGKL